LPALIETALADLEARRADGKRLDVRDLSAPLELNTRAGTLRLVPEPEGTRGYDDLRRRASREPIGRGLRPLVAFPADLARMIGALDREEQLDTLLRLRRTMELDRPDRSPDIER
jgi:hypothetical protein